MDGAHKGIVVCLLESRWGASNERTVQQNNHSVECRERRDYPWTNGIEAGNKNYDMWGVCYSLAWMNGTMIATGGAH